MPDCQGEEKTPPEAASDVFGFACVAADIPRPGAGILTGFPFGAGRTIAPLSHTAFAYPLGPTDPCPTAVRTEPFPTSVFKVLV